MECVIGILVLYKCLLEDSLTFISLQKSLHYANMNMDLIVYDNSPVSLNLKSEYIYGKLKINYIWDPSNGGVSKAYNKAFEYAKERNKNWILILDQDTLLPENAILIYSETINHNNIKHEIIAPVLYSDYGFMSPSKYFLFKASVSDKYTLGVNSFNNKTLLNSGLLISVKLFELTGGYNVNIPLDFSDTEFISRVKKIRKTFFLINVMCIHAISTYDNDKMKVLSRFKFYCKGMREYAQTSNGFLLIYGWAILRTLKLTFYYKDITFIRIFLNKKFSHAV